MSALLHRLPFAVDPLMAEAKRRARKRRVLIAVVALVVLGGGAAGTMFALRSVRSLTPASQGIDVASIENTHSSLQLGARVNPRERFPSPSRAVLLRRLRLAANRYDFTLVQVQILHPLQGAPFVVVETADEAALSASTPAILRVIDPRARRASDRAGWAYEGFLFEARNTNGVPFLATYNWWRNPRSSGGGQAASSESLYPFSHG